MYKTVSIENTQLFVCCHGYCDFLCCTVNFYKSTLCTTVKENVSIYVLLKSHICFISTNSNTPCVFSSILFLKIISPLFAFLVNIQEKTEMFVFHWSRIQVQEKNGSNNTVLVEERALCIKGQDNGSKKGFVIEFRRRQISLNLKIAEFKNNAFKNTYQC